MKGGAMYEHEQVSDLVKQIYFKDLMLSWERTNDKQITLRRFIVLCPMVSVSVSTIN